MEAANEPPASESVTAEIYDSFRETSTIHGVLLLRSQSGAYRVAKYVTAILPFATAVSLLSYLSWLTVANFLQYKVATTLTIYQAMPGTKDPTSMLPFPSITIVNNNQFLRSKMGFSYLFYVPLLMDTNINLTPLRAVYEGGIQCNSSAPKSAIIGNYTSFMDFMLYAINTFAISFTDEYNALNHNLSSTFVRCAWQGKPISCNKTVVGHMGSFGYELTFNPSQTFIDYFNDTTAGLVDGYEEYGATLQDVTNTNLLVNTPGPRGGAEFILNVMPDEYCTSGLQYTYGFTAFVLDPEDPAKETLLEKGIDLTPGFHTDVSIRMTQFHRHTENLGYCLPKYSFYMFPDYPRYTQSVCFRQCFAAAVIEQCDCMDFTVPVKAQLLAQKHYGQTYPICLNASQAGCRNSVIKGDLSRRGIQGGSVVDMLQQFCPYCRKIECDEVRYDTSVTVSYFPAKNQLAQMLALVNATNRSMSIDDFRKTYVSANFYMETMQYRVIDEVQAIMPMDLVNNLGCALGLCVGASVISIIEVVFVFVYCIQSRCPQRRRRVRPAIKYYRQL